MSDQDPGNRAFVEQQRKRLEALRKQLTGAEASQDARERIFGKSMEGGQGIRRRSSKHGRKRD